jgi:hypothetical protein
MPYNTELSDIFGTTKTKDKNPEKIDKIFQ